MQDIVTQTLEELVRGSNLETQKVFTVLEQREDVVVNEARENNFNEGKPYERQQNKNESSRKVDSDSDQAGERNDECDIEVRTEITNRSKSKVYVLTNLGKSFVNTIVDHACAEKASEVALNGEDKIGDYVYPNIGLTKLVNHSRKSFFNTDARIIDANELLAYDVEYELFCDEEGEVIDTLDPDEFEIIWKQLLRASKKMDNVNVSTKLTKPVLYWDNMNCAFSEEGKLMKVIGKTTTKEERYIAQLMKSKWNVPSDIFLEVDRKVTSNEDLLLEFLTSIQGSSDNNSGNGKRSNNKGKNNPRYSKFKQSKPQPENDSKANALNPNQQENNIN